MMKHKEDNITDMCVKQENKNRIQRELKESKSYCLFLRLWGFWL